jgi:hypothetical protein
VAAVPSAIPECSTGQLNGMATLDDNTVNVLGGGDIDWGTVTYPFASVSTDGVLTAANVYAETNGMIRASYLGASVTTNILVLDSDSDNFGLYARDDVPDGWQVAYFGVNNPKGIATADATGTGQNNLFKYVAGLDPTNPASIFVLKIDPVLNQPIQKNLLFNPLATGRTYTPQFSTNLSVAGSLPLGGYTGPVTNGNQVTITDTNAIEPRKFYRIKISLP